MGRFLFESYKLIMGTKWDQDGMRDQVRWGKCTYRRNALYLLWDWDFFSFSFVNEVLPFKRRLCLGCILELLQESSGIWLLMLSGLERSNSPKGPKVSDFRIGFGILPLLNFGFCWFIPSLDKSKDPLSLSVDCGFTKRINKPENPFQKYNLAMQN